MKLLLDQNIYACTMRFLANLGHDPIVVSTLGLARATDIELLQKSHEMGRIFVTRDRDFGNLVFIQNFGAGIRYLRMQPSNQEAVHLELQRVLDAHSEDELMRACVVIEPGRHRFRQLGSASE